MGMEEWSIFFVVYFFFSACSIIPLRRISAEDKLVANGYHAHHKPS